jgi:hypothetical protein
MGFSFSLYYFSYKANILADDVIIEWSGKYHDVIGLNFNPSPRDLHSLR